MLLGNPLLDFDISVLAGDCLWSHGAISDETLTLEKAVRNDSKFLPESVHRQRYPGCIEVFIRVLGEVGYDTDHGDLLSPVCLLSMSTEQPKSLHGMIHKTMIARSEASGDPCLPGRIFYLNSPQVQKGRHSNPAKELKLLPFTTYAPWYDHKQVEGWSQSFGAFRDGKNMTYLTFITVRGAANEVPFTSPSQALTLFRSCLTGSPLPGPHSLSLEPYFPSHFSLSFSQKPPRKCSNNTTLSKSEMVMLL